MDSNQVDTKAMAASNSAAWNVTGPGCEKTAPDLDSVEPLKPDLVCFSHLRWNFVYQRPQHLLSRAARDRRVFFIEEPVFDSRSMGLEINQHDDGVVIVVPH